MPKGVYNREKAVKHPPKVVPAVKKELEAFNEEVKPNFKPPTPPVTVVDTVPTFANVEEPDHCLTCKHLKKFHYGSKDNWCNMCGCLKWKPF